VQRISVAVVFQPAPVLMAEGSTVLGSHAPISSSVVVVLLDVEVDVEVVVVVDVVVEVFRVDVDEDVVVDVDDVVVLLEVDDDVLVLVVLDVDVVVTAMTVHTPSWQNPVQQFAVAEQDPPTPTMQSATQIEPLQDPTQQSDVFVHASPICAVQQVAISEQSKQEPPVPSHRHRPWSR
jgi:hypothetical protein